MPWLAVPYPVPRAGNSPSRRAPAAVGGEGVAGAMIERQRNARLCRNSPNNAHLPVDLSQSVTVLLVMYHLPGASIPALTAFRGKALKK